MSDWTYEMLRYAFSWNDESSEKALKYVVTGRSPSESMSEVPVLPFALRMLDILLLTILTEKDEVERTSALVFLEEHGKSLVWDEELRGWPRKAQLQERLRKVYFVLENILGSPVDGQGMTYSLNCEVLVTYTALLIQFNTFEKDVARFEATGEHIFWQPGVSSLDVQESHMHTLRTLERPAEVKHTNKSADRILRAYACECLHELESWHPGLLFPLLGEDWRVPPIWAEGMTATPKEGAAVVDASATLGKFVNDELLHIQELYARLFFTTIQHFTEQLLNSPLTTAPQERQEELAATPPLTPRRSTSSASGAARGAPEVREMPGVKDAMFRFHIPRRARNCSRGPGMSFDLPAEQTPPRLPRKLLRIMTRSIGLVLDAMPTSLRNLPRTKIFIAERLSLFVRVLALPQRVVFHHFSPLLHASRPSLLHAFMVVNALFAKEARNVDKSVAEAVLHRLFALLQDGAMEPCKKLWALGWLIALTTKVSFEMLWARIQELCPRWHVPWLRCKRPMRTALLYCFKLSQNLPSNLLIVLESLSEFKYCQRPARLLSGRVVVSWPKDFPSEMDRLEVEVHVADCVHKGNRALSWIPAVQAVQYKLLHSLGHFVSTLEPPSRIQRYFGLLVILSEMPWLDPRPWIYVLTALRRLVFCPSCLTWEAGMLGAQPSPREVQVLGPRDISVRLRRVLITCRRMILSHPQAVIYQPMLRLLQHLATYQLGLSGRSFKPRSDVDLRDRALLYLRRLWGKVQHLSS
eukprot:Skav217234  [mRNA]  locus=scaffold110:125763:137391:+ [translate_table: standard]